MNKRFFSCDFCNSFLPFCGGPHPVFLEQHHDDNDDDGMQSLIGSFVDNHVSLMDPTSSWYGDELMGCSPSMM
ncbi:unnamed protein product [Brassica napus]|uniref:(rape) hypothetical protein n=1 Tax=Brassica napus TaxID=3708 RepID=A0A816MKK6_BRANA|nr:unnamed protein product [Brassica napus]